MNFKQELLDLNWNEITRDGKKVFVTNIMNTPIMDDIFCNLDKLNKWGYSIDDRGCLSTFDDPHSVKDLIKLKEPNTDFPENPYGPYMNGSLDFPNEKYGLDEESEEPPEPPAIPAIPAIQEPVVAIIPKKINQNSSLNTLAEIIDIKKNVLSDVDSRRKHKIEKIVSKIQLKYEKELYPYQINHVKLLINAITQNKVAIDASDTGTGKTHSAYVLAKQLKHNVIIMCPKPVIAVWKSAAKMHRFQEYTEDSPKRWFYCTNYEQFKGGNTPFLKVKVKKDETKYRWNVPENTIIVVDECHKFKNYKTHNFRMIDAVNTGKVDKTPILLLSATLVDKLQFIYPIGKLTGLFQSYLGCRNWIKNQMIIANKGSVDSHCMHIIHQHIFPEYGSRMRIAEIGDSFPENLVIYEPCTTSSNNADVNQIYKTMMKRVRKIIKLKGTPNNILTIMLRARQAAELTKVPSILEMTDEYIESGCSVVIFVNFNDTLEHLATSLKTDCTISGHNPELRDSMIAKFQSDESRVIICNIQSGGIGISLHDINGKYPRRSIMVPSWNAMDTQQCLGRICRAGGKSKCIQKILYCPDSIEESIVKLIKDKVSNIESFNNGREQMSIFNETMKILNIPLKDEDVDVEKSDVRKIAKKSTTQNDADLYEPIVTTTDDKRWNCIVSVEYVRNISELDVVFTIKKGGEGEHMFDITKVIQLYEKEIASGTNKENDILAEYGIGIIKKKNVKKMSHMKFLRMDRKYNDSTNIWFSWNDILYENYTTK